MAQYRSGTVDVTNASQVVTGTLTLWSAPISAGDLFTIDGSTVLYEIGSVDSDTQITLNANYAGTTETGLTYSISRDFTPNFQIPFLSKGDIDTATVLKRSFEVLDSALLTAGSAAGALISVIGTVDLTSATAQNIGAATGIPASATVLSVTLAVTTASDAATTVAIGDVTNGSASYMAASENFADSVGIYVADGFLLNGAGARQAQATVSTAGTVGTATCVITLIVP